MSAHTSVQDLVRGRKVLVTGGTGSIGFALVREVLRHEPAVVRILSRDESKQYLAMDALGERPDIRFLIGDVRDVNRLASAFADVDLVLHAAALKHVPLCEYNPFEAVQTNVLGTQNVITAALEAGVKRVIMVSTDKAVNPQNTMGATKLLAERLVLTANLWATRATFACVRFGNVLGSRGSLVQIVAQQIARGGPVTLTDPQMTRFFMTIRGACALVLEAACRMEGGEVFIFKMPSVRVEDLVAVLVEDLAPRHGRKPADIRVEVTGRRPGEKVEEELLTSDEVARAREKEEMIVVEQVRLRMGHAAAAVGAIGDPLGAPLPAIDPARYVSSRAPLLGRDAIRALLVEAGILGGAAPWEL